MDALGGIWEYAYEVRIGGIIITTFVHGGGGKVKAGMGMIGMMTTYDDAWRWYYEQVPTWLGWALGPFLYRYIDIYI